MDVRLIHTYPVKFDIETSWNIVREQTLQIFSSIAVMTDTVTIHLDPCVYRSLGPPGPVEAGSPEAHCNSWSDLTDLPHVSGALLSDWSVKPGAFSNALIWRIARQQDTVRWLVRYATWRGCQWFAVVLIIISSVAKHHTKWRHKDKTQRHKR